MTPSVGSVGDSYDNALAESVIGLYKTEVIAHQGPWRDLAQAETATAAWGGWFNQQRLFWPIGRPPPAQYAQAVFTRRLGTAPPPTRPQRPRQNTRETTQTPVRGRQRRREGEPAPSGETDVGKEQKRKIIYWLVKAPPSYRR